MRHRKLACDLEDLAGQEALNVAAPLPAQSEIERLEDFLLDHGVEYHQIPGLLKPLNAFVKQRIKRAAGRRAAEAIRQLMLRLEGTSGGVALRTVVCGADGSQRQLGAEAGVSHTAIQKQIATISQRLGLPMGANIE